MLFRRKPFRQGLFPVKEPVIFLHAQFQGGRIDLPSLPGHVSLQEGRRWWKPSGATVGEWLWLHLLSQGAQHLLDCFPVGCQGPSPPQEGTHQPCRAQSRVLAAPGHTDLTFQLAQVRDASPIGGGWRSLGSSWLTVLLEPRKPNVTGRQMSSACLLEPSPTQTQQR